MICWAVSITHTAFLFADNAKIFQIVTSFHDHLLLQIDLHEIEQWCSTWNLQLHPSKCHVLKFMLGKTVPIPNQLEYYYLLGNTITYSNFETDLGLVVQCDLSWSEHYIRISAKAYNSLHLIRRTLSPSAENVIYNPSAITSNLRFPIMETSFSQRHRQFRTNPEKINQIYTGWLRQ